MDHAAAGGMYDARARRTVTHSRLPSCDVEPVPNGSAARLESMCSRRIAFVVAAMSPTRAPFSVPDDLGRGPLGKAIAAFPMPTPEHHSERLLPLKGMRE